MTSLETIASRVQQAVGLDPAALGWSTVRLAVQARMRQRGTRAEEEYAALLASSEAELAELVEEMVVPETWFFRDRQPFLALARWVQEEWLPAHAGQALRILSVPCASGEEPYSIVMALLDAGVSPDRFVVEGVDVSQRLLDRTRAGVYGKNAFRGDELAFRDRHFHATREGYRLSDEVRRQVHFRQGNLLDPLFAGADRRYDVVFCRNLLIYFDTAAQQRAIGVMGRLLAPEGLLFAGHAETVLLSGAKFVAADMPLAFAFHPRQAAGSPTAPAGRRAAAQSAAVVGHRQPANGMVSPPPRPRPVPPATGPARQAGPPQHAPVVDLEEARRLADAGRLEAAVERCRLYLQAHGPAAAAYYLIGLALDAGGLVAEASENYRKALYLEPEHSEALVHLALLVEKEGDRAGARVLHDRARRLAARLQQRKAVA